MRGNAKTALSAQIRVSFGIMILNLGNGYGPYQPFRQPFIYVHPVIFRRPDHVIIMTWKP
jgi:hypothetical protein